jgi:hypothetical protein
VKIPKISVASFKTIRSNAPVVTTIQNAPILKSFTPEEIENNLKEPFPFTVERRKSGFLPIYRQFKNGNTRSVTVIRGIKGSIEELIKFLGILIPEKRIRKKSDSALQIEGNYVSPIREVLTAHKF